MPAVDVVKRRAKAATLSRPGAHVVTDGYSVPGAASTTPNFSAHIQYLTAEEIRNLPEGQNAIDWRNIWSEFEMQYLDEISQDGVTWAVQRFEYWPEGQFWHAMAVRVRDTL